MIYKTRVKEHWREVPRQIRKKKFRYGVILSKNMLRQGIKMPKVSFRDFNSAYRYGASRFGSGTYSISYLGKQIGWYVGVWEAR